MRGRSIPQGREDSSVAGTDQPFLGHRVSHVDAAGIAADVTHRVASIAAKSRRI